MKISTLNNKLSKLNVQTTIVDYNGYNKSLVFTINGKKYEADFNSVHEEVNSFSFSLMYDEANQETQRRFFDNFAQVQRHANN